MLKKFRRYDKSTRLLLDLALVVFVIAVAQQVYIWTRPEAKAYLDYPEQKITNRYVLGAPSVQEQDDVVVVGSKCNFSERGIKVSGTVTWVSADPPGTQIKTGEGSTTRESGCESFRFINPIPKEVVERTKDLATPDHPFVTWRITGHEVPEDPNILSESWTTEPFDIYTANPRGGRE